MKKFLYSTISRMYSFYNGFLFFVVLLFLLWSSTLVNTKMRKYFLNLGIIFLILLFIYYLYFNSIRQHFIKEGFDINEYGPGPFGEITNMYQFQLQKLASSVKEMPVRDFSQKVVIDNSKKVRLIPNQNKMPIQLKGILIFKIDDFIYFIAIKANNLKENEYEPTRSLPSQFIIPGSIYYYANCDISNFNEREIYVYSINKIEPFSVEKHRRFYPDYLLGSLEPSEITNLRNKSISVNSIPFSETDGYSVFQIQEPNTGYIISGWADKKNNSIANLAAGQKVAIVFDIYDLGLFISFNEVKQSPSDTTNLIEFYEKIPNDLLNSQWKLKIFNASKPESYQGTNDDIYFFRIVNPNSFSSKVKKETSKIEKEDKTKDDATPQLETHCYTCFSTDPKQIYYKIDQSGENAQPMGITLPDTSYNQECSQFPLSLFGTDAIKCNLSDQTIYLTNPPSSEEVMDMKFGVNQGIDGSFKEPLKMNSSVMNKTVSNKKSSNINGEDIDIDQLRNPTTLNINVAYYTKDGGNMDSTVSDNDMEIKNNKISDNYLLNDNTADVSLKTPDQNKIIFNPALNNTNPQITSKPPSKPINDDIEPNNITEHIKAVRKGGEWNNTENDCALKGNCDKIEYEAHQKAQTSFNNHMGKQTKNWNVGNDFNNQFTNQSGVVLGGGTCDSEGANYFCRYSYLPINPAYYRPVADIMDNYNGVNSAPDGYSVFPSTDKWLQKNKDEVNRYKDFYNNYYKNINELRLRGIEGYWKGYKGSNPPL